MTQRPILLVEDNDDDAELTRMAFSQAHVDNPLIRVHDGVEALDYLFRRGRYTELPDDSLPVVVLLDLKLPRVGGLQVLREIRETPRTSCLPVVVLTSSDEHSDLIGAYSAHANSYVRKPVDYDLFVEASTQLGLYWTVTNLGLPRHA
ncbi:MAG TPA: response regulator [Polyangiales bacterium]|nr:response regulator [Polyangiales bacterium]